MACDWTAAKDAILGTMTDPEAAKRLGVSVDQARKRRNRLGIPPYSPPARTCLACDSLAVGNPGFCHRHHERWTRWGKPDPQQWGAAFREGRLNLCAVCGAPFNGYYGCRHCSPECLAEYKREAALARYHALTPEEKRRAIERSLERGRARRQAAWVTIACVICGDEFRGPPHRRTCGKSICRSQNVTRGSRNYRVRRATAEIAQAAAKLQEKTSE